jgi:hypothetical protein
MNQEEIKEKALADFKERMIDKSCEWLRSKLVAKRSVLLSHLEDTNCAYIIEDYRKAMEELSI